MNDSDGIRKQANKLFGQGQPSGQRFQSVKSPESQAPWRQAIEHWNRCNPKLAKSFHASKKSKCGAQNAIRSFETWRLEAADASLAAVRLTPTFLNEIFCLSVFADISHCRFGYQKRHRYMVISEVKPNGHQKKLARQ